MAMMLLLIPAAPTRPCQLVPLPGGPDQLSRLGELVGGSVEPARYDRDAHLYVNGDGGPLGLPVNRRATSYIRARSLAARLHQARGRAWEPWYVLRGDVVLAGTDPGDPDRDLEAPPRFLELFEVPGRAELPAQLPVVGGPDGRRDAPNLWGFPPATVLQLGDPTRTPGWLGGAYSLALDGGGYLNCRETTAPNPPYHRWLVADSVTAAPTHQVVYQPDQAAG
jgi:hypothetical protein